MITYDYYYVIVVTKRKRGKHNLHNMHDAHNKKKSWLPRFLSFGI